MEKKEIQPVVFLGVVDRYIERNHNPFPVGKTDLMGISLVKNYVIYPSPDSRSFLFLVHKSIIEDFNSGKAYLRIELPDGKEFFKCKIEVCSNESEGIDIEGLGYFEFQDWLPLNVSNYKALVPYPGIYPVFYGNEREEVKISDICFHYSPSSPLTADELHGLKSRLLSCHIVRLNLKCEDCGDSIKTYTSIEKNVSSEKDGYIWYSNLPDKFVCKCGKVDYTLKYYKESMHGLLKVVTIKNDYEGGSAKYERLYSHQKIRGIVASFLDLLEKEKSENKIQKFIENNPVLLSPFNAKKLFNKPSILGKYEADFAILDANNNLIFIEIEKPHLPLFQKIGHPRAELNHAYDQVRDWLLEYRTSSQQILDRIGLKEEDVCAVKGFVIAGVLEESDRENYRKHQKKNENNEIGFMSFDELASSVLNLSSELI